MEACPCPSAASGGHRLMQAGCDDLPDTCPSLGCAEEAVGFATDCEALLAQTAYFVDGIPMAKFDGLLSSCRGLKAGAGQMLLQPVEVQRFKMRVETTEGEAQSGRSASRQRSSSAAQSKLRRYSAQRQRREV